TPDSQTIVTAANQGPERPKESSVRLWQAATGKHLVPEGPRREPRPLLSLHPDRKTPPTTRGAALQVKGAIRDLALSPDGQSLIARSEDSKDHTVQLWDVKTGEQRGSPLQHQNRILAWAFSPDSRTVLTGSEDKTARLWDVKTGKQIGPSWQHPVPVGSVRFTPTGQIAVTSDYRGHTRLWEPTSGKQLGTPLTSGAVWELRPVDQAILRGQEGTVRLLDVKTGEPLGPPLLHQRPVTQLVFSPDGNTVATGSDGMVRLWEPRSGKSLGQPLQ